MPNDTTPQCSPSGPVAAGGCDICRAPVLDSHKKVVVLDTHEHAYARMKLCSTCLVDIRKSRRFEVDTIQT